VKPMLILQGARERVAGRAGPRRCLPDQGPGLERGDLRRPAKYWLPGSSPLRGRRSHFSFVGQVLQEVKGAGNNWYGTVLSGDGRLVAARWGIYLAVFRADAFAAGPVVHRNDSSKAFTGLAFHPSGRFLAATCTDGTAKLYDTGTWKVALGHRKVAVGRLQSGRDAGRGRRREG
jgi:hypothetical protein